MSYENLERGFNSETSTILTGTSNPNLAKAIGETLEQKVKTASGSFKDGEVRTKIEESVRGKHVFIIQQTAPPAENLLQLLTMIDAAKRGSAKEITAVIPYYGYARQDRITSPGEPISASLFAHLIMETGANGIVTVDLHSPQTLGSVRIPWDNLYASRALSSCA